MERHTRRPSSTCSDIKAGRRGEVQSPIGEELVKVPLLVAWLLAVARVGELGLPTLPDRYRVQKRKSARVSPVVSAKSQSCPE